VFYTCNWKVWQILLFYSILRPQNLSTLGECPTCGITVPVMWIALKQQSHWLHTADKSLLELTAGQLSTKSPLLITPKCRPSYPHESSRLQSAPIGVRFSEIHFHFILQLNSRSSNLPLHFRSPNHNSMCVFTSSTHATCLAYPILLYIITVLIYATQ